MATTADAVAREVAWLTTTGGGLPSLLKSASGPWDICQGYWPRTQAARKTGIYLLRTSLREDRFANHRKINRYTFLAKLWWPIGSTTTASGLWETEQAAFDSAIDLLIARVRGLPGDHTHGGRFLSVAEAPTPGHIDVRFHDPQHTTSGNPAVLTAEATWMADDYDFTA